VLRFLESRHAWREDFDRIDDILKREIFEHASTHPNERHGCASMLQSQA